MRHEGKAVVLDCGLQVDLRVVPAVSFGTALHYFTGSKPHNIGIRALGLECGLKINEYGVFRGTRRIGGRTEEQVFEAVGLPWIGNCEFFRTLGKDFRQECLEHALRS